MEAKDGEHNGGEFHQIHFALDENNSLVLEIDAQCYGTHSTSFQMSVPCIGPDELERFGFDLINIAKEMRKKDSEAN